MNRRNEAGKSGMMIGMLFIGVLLIVGIIIIVRGMQDEQPIEQTTTNVELQEPEVVNTIEGAEPEPVEETEDVTPAAWKTVDGTGRTVYVGRKKENVVLPGKGVVKATKMATATNKRMKAAPKRPVKIDADHIRTLHPANRKKNQGDGTDKPKTGNADQGGNSGTGNAGGGNSGGGNAGGSDK